MMYLDSKARATGENELSLGLTRPEAETDKTLPLAFISHTFDKYTNDEASASALSR